MKHFSRFLLLLLFACGLRAQAQTTDSLSQKLTSIFANVDKTQVPTGYLYEAGVRFLELHHYNGTLSDSNRTDMNVLRYLRAQLRSSRVNGNVVDTLPSLPVFNQRLKGAEQAANGVIPIAMQYHPYASIRPDALQNNLLQAQGEQLFDVAGRSQSPYQTNPLFVAAPARGYAPTNTVSFLFRRNLFLTGNGQLPLRLYLDFGDGRGYQPVTWGQPISTTYATSGMKRLKVKADFADLYWTQPYESHFDLDVRSVVATEAYSYSADAGFTVRIGPGNRRPGALVSVRYGAGHGAHVVKPFIIVEQYNIAGVAPHLVECNNANNTIEIFDDKIENVTLQSGVTFNESLHAAGYDLVYIDFDRNTDDITLNAQVFERVVQQINAYKSTSRTQFGLAVDQNVVMGMSMGGLIARYGLAEMTKNTFPFGPPDTRLLVLHDSPQRGAYNPVGLQSFTRSTDVPLNIISLNPFGGSFLGQPKLRDLDDRLDDAVNVLDEPASKQLGILNAFDGRGDIRPNTFIDGDYKNMVDFTLPANASGPQPAYPIVATSDGSQCGRGSGAPAGVLLSSADTYTKNWLAPVAAGIPFSLGVRGAAYGLPPYGQQALISRMRIYIQYGLRFGFGSFGVIIPIRFNLLNESASSPPNTLPYETLPGGTTNLARESGNCGTTTGIAAAFLKTSLYNGDICFVPSYSALDVPVAAPSTAYAKYINNTTDNPAPPRVVRYIAQESSTTGSLFNLNHLTFTPRNSEWIFNEMQRPFNGNTNPLPCATECSLSPQVQLTGSDFQCPGGAVTYTLTGVPAGYTVTWSNTVGGTPATTSGTSYTFTIPASRTTNGEVTATLSSPCDSRSLTAPVRVVPQLSFVRSNPNSLQCAVLALATTYGFDNPRWVVNGVEDTGTPVVMGEQEQFDLPNGGTLRLALRGTNRCTGQRTTTTTRLYSISAGCYNRTAAPVVSIYPNPAREFVRVEVENADPAQPVTVRLYDRQGLLRLEETSTGPQKVTLRLKAARLPAGLYLVQVLQGTQVLSRQPLQVE